MATSAARPSGLTEKDEKAATKAVAAHPEIARHLTGGRALVVLRTADLSRRRAPGPARLAVVGVHDHESGGSIFADVDLDTGDVVAVGRSRAVLQLSADERNEADRFASADERVRAFCAKGALNPLTRLYFPPPGEGIDQTHRHAIVFVRPGPGRRVYAVVDLTAGRVVDVLSRYDLTADRTDEG